MEIAVLRSRFLAAFAALLITAGASAAFADSKVRVEFVRLAQPGEAGGALTNQPTRTVAAQELTVTTTPTLSQAAPSFGDKSGNPITQGAVRITALSGAVIVDWGTAPSVTEGGGYRVEPGAPLIIPMTTGLKLSLAQAAVGPSDTYTYEHGLLGGEDLTNNVLGTIPKPVVAPTYARSADVSFGSLVTHNAKATPALLFAFRATNTNAAVRYLQAYNSTGSTTGTPVYSEPIAAGSATAPGSLTLSSDFFGLNGSYFSVGLTWAISTTAATYTAATAADHTVNVQFK